MWRKIVVCLLLLGFVPGTAVAGLLMKNNHYLLGGLLIMVWILLAFFLHFENRRPAAKDLAVLAVLCALTIACRGLFSMLPNVMPAAAIIIIAGMALGAEAGFVVGAMSMFVSNFLVGQGTWTPWQMVVYGLLGALAGIGYKIGLLQGKMWRSILFTIVVNMCIVGPLLDTFSLLSLSGKITKETAITIYGTGVPINALHTVGAVVALVLLQKPMLGQLLRMKEKYGVMQDEISE